MKLLLDACVWGGAVVELKVAGHTSYTAPTWLVHGSHGFFDSRPIMPNLFRIGRAVGWIFHQASTKKIGEFFIGPILQPMQIDVIRIVTREHCVRNKSKGVDIAAWSYLALLLLGSHPTRCSHPNVSGRSVLDRIFDDAEIGQFGVI